MIYNSQVTVKLPDGRTASYHMNSTVSMHDSKVQAYVHALLYDGFVPWPLREKWWQIWRPTEYPDALQEALDRQNPA